MNDNDFITIDDTTYSVSDVRNVYKLMEALNQKLAPEDFELLKTVLDEPMTSSLLLAILFGDVILEDPG